MPVNETVYNVGDIVRIREWDDMVAEYGIEQNGYVLPTNTKVYFSRHMKHLCGQQFVIKQVTNDEKQYRLEGENWVFTKEMFDTSFEYKDMPDSDYDIDFLLS